MFRDFRLEALLSDSLAFGSTYQQEVLYDKRAWCECIEHMWFAFLDEQRAGMIGLIDHESDPGSQQLISFWVHPAYRGQGVGTALINALQEHALKSSIKKIFLFVTTTQTSSICPYEKLHFVKEQLIEDRMKKDGHFYDQYCMVWYRPNSSASTSEQSC